MSIFFCLFISFDADAGAWPTAAGSGQIISTSLFDNANRGFDEHGNLEQDVFFNKAEASIYWEHGLSAKTTLVLQSSYQDIQFRAGVDDVNFSGIGESSIGLRQVLWGNGGWIVSGQVSAFFAGEGEPIADADLGFGSTHYEARFLVGHALKISGRDAFLDLQGARRFRSGNQPSEWRLDATAGWRPFEKFQIIGQGFYTQSEEKFEISRRNTRLKLQTSLVYDHSPKTSYQIGLYQTVAGINIVKEKAYFISIWKRY